MTAWSRGRLSVAVNGPVAVVHRVIRDRAVPWTWDSRTGVWVLPQDRADEVFAVLELLGHNVDYRDAPW